MSIVKEDVYESEGNVDENSKNVSLLQDDPKNPDIEIVSVDVDEAMKKYKGKVLNLKSVDYSDYIAKKRRHAFGNNVYVLEVAGSGYSGLETPTEKLNRILYEIADLNEQVKGDESLKNDLLNEEVLESLSAEVKNLQTTSKTPVSHDSANIDIAQRTSDPKLYALDARLRKLEKVLGSTVIPTVPILDSIEDMKLRCETLNSSYVSGLEQRLNVLLTKFDQVEEKKARHEIDDDIEKKINDILEMMQKWDVACSSLSSNVNKVKALSRLHEQAQQFASRLSHLQKIREKLEKEVVQGRAAILEFETTGKSEMAVVIDKLKQLEATVANLK
ncbi:unnamed protein product [Caenorhabditis bovis]|uniref:Uncharacterized protein n=1 Tax=Caenorhabditis bovis TaxID=2654633 RepID=A0A8S1EWQ5_9PELO|nr:unnamed protein product [Caenorhabditis bovis]